MLVLALQDCPLVLGTFTSSICLQALVPSGQLLLAAAVFNPPPATIRSVDRGTHACRLANAGALQALLLGPLFAFARTAALVLVWHAQPHAQLKCY